MRMSADAPIVLKSPSSECSFTLDEGAREHSSNKSAGDSRTTPSASVSDVSSAEKGIYKNDEEPEGRTFSLAFSNSRERYIQTVHSAPTTLPESALLHNR